MNLSRTCVAAAILVLAGVAQAQDLGPGLYAMTADGTGRIVNRADTDGQVGLGQRLSEQLREATLVSESNDNSQFRLSLVAGPIPEHGGPQSLALFVAGQCIPVWGQSDRKADGTIAVEGNVGSQAAAAKIAAELNIKPQTRQHPGHQLLVTFQAQKPAYLPGEAVTLVMTIKNVGRVTVRFYDGGSQRGARNNQFGFTAFRFAGESPALPDIGDPMNFGGKMGLPTLAPGDTFTKEVELTNWFKFSEAGSYRITGMYHLTLLGEGDQRPRTVLWDDFAVAGCTVRVLAPPATAPAAPAATPGPPPK